MGSFMGECRMLCRAYLPVVEGPEEAPQPRSGTAGVQEGAQRPWWRRVFRAWRRRVFGGRRR